MRDVFRASEQWTFKRVDELYTQGKQDSLDAIGVPVNPNRFAKLIRLDEDGGDALFDKKRGPYTVKDFRHEVKYAHTAMQFGLAPVVYESGTVTGTCDGNVKCTYGYIVFDRLDGSLEDFMNRREESIEKQFIVASPVRWGDMSDDEWSTSSGHPSLTTPPPSRRPSLSTANVTQAVTALDDILDDFMKRMRSAKFFHTDMHPGNIFYKRVSDDNKQWFLIDFGRVALPDDKGGFVETRTNRRFANEADVWKHSTRFLRNSLRDMTEVDPEVPAWDKLLRSIRAWLLTPPRATTSRPTTPETTPPQTPRSTPRTPPTR
jgi:hypothetical protein